MGRRRWRALQSALEEIRELGARSPKSRPGTVEGGRQGPFARTCLVGPPHGRPKGDLARGERPGEALLRPPRSPPVSFFYGKRRPLSGRRDCEEQGPSQKDAFPPTAYEIYGTCLQLFILGSLT